MTTYCDSCGNVFAPDDTGSRCCPDCRLTLPGDRKSEDPWQKVSDLEQDNAQLKDRLRTTCQILVEAVGADGPTDAEDVARRIVEELRQARAERDTMRDTLTRAQERGTALLTRAREAEARVIELMGAAYGDDAFVLIIEERLAEAKKLAKALHTLALWLDSGCSAPPDESYRSQGWESVEEDVPGWRAIYKELTGVDTEG